MSQLAVSASFEYLCYGHDKKLFLIHLNTYFHMLWVYGRYKCCYSDSAGIDFRRQILMSKIDPRAVRVKPLRTNRAVFNPFYQPSK